MTIARAKPWAALLPWRRFATGVPAARDVRGNR